MTLPVFIWPEMLWLLLLLPLLALLYAWLQRRRARVAQRFAAPALWRQALGRPPGVSRHVPPLLFLLALTSTIVGMARPQAVVQLPKREGTIILAIDVSGSMGADDVKPTRMEAARAAARDFVAQQPASVRVGVVSFTDSAFIVQAPTTNRETVTAAINRLQPQKGTALGRGLLTALDAIFGTASADTPPGTQSAPGPTPTPPPLGEHSSAIIILLTDGENNMGSDPLDAAQQAARRGVRVFTVGIGTPEGAVLHAEGMNIRTRLDEATLKTIADMTDGEYHRAKSEEDLRAIYGQVGAETVWTTEKSEITFGFAGAAIALALAAGVLSLVWFNRLP